MEEVEEKEKGGDFISSLRGPSPKSGYEDESDPHRHLIILFIIVIVIGAIISYIAP